MQHHVRTWLVAMCASITLVSGTAVAGPVLISVDVATDQIFEFDVGSATVTPGATLDRAVVDSASSLDVSPTDGLIYLGDRQASPATLATVDPVTGAVTGVPTIISTTVTENIAFAPDGTLWAGSIGDLFTIDIGAGTSAYSHSLALDMDAIDFDSAGTLWIMDVIVGASILYRHDVVTETTTTVATLPGHFFFGLAFAPDGDLYGLDTSANELYRIAPTGGLTFVMNAGSATGLSSLSALTTEPVPEPSAAALFGLGVVAVAARRRRFRGA